MTTLKEIDALCNDLLAKRERQYGSYDKSSKANVHINEIAYLKEPVENFVTLINGGRMSIPVLID